LATAVSSQRDVREASASRDAKETGAFTNTARLAFTDSEISSETTPITVVVNWLAGVKK
jgi:hypothetical protein